MNGSDERELRAARNQAALRFALAARVEGCWDRLDDVVNELVSVHGVSTASTIARVIKVAEAGDGPDPTLHLVRDVVDDDDPLGDALRPRTERS